MMRLERNNSSSIPSPLKNNIVITTASLYPSSNGDVTSLIQFLSFMVFHLFCIPVH